jgi:hypothetical protein
MAQRYYQALALQKLGQPEQAARLLQDLVTQAARALESAGKPDPAASCEAQHAARSRLATAHYIAGLGHLGLSDQAKAKEAFAKALEWSPDHLGARTATVSAR